MPKLVVRMERTDEDKMPLRLQSNGLIGANKCHNNPIDYGINLKVRAAALMRIIIITVLFNQGVNIRKAQFFSLVNILTGLSFLVTIIF